MSSIIFEPVWFDSLGAKSSCIRVETPDLSILVDPGVAAMQPSFPATEAQRKLWKAQGRKAIEEASDVDLVVISHYHHDHYIRDDPGFYAGKTICAKDPNRFINDSQRKRAEAFYQELYRHLGAVELDAVVERNVVEPYTDPLEGLPLARERDFGDYRDRREALLRKGRARFRHMVAEWNERPRIPALEFGGCRVVWADGAALWFGRTQVRFTPPLFHGIEYATVGWVIATVITYDGEKLIHSSDLNGVYIEDYARWLIEEDPDVLILDGPPTYLLGYLLNRINLQRCVDNLCRIVEETSTGLIILDHHLPREPRFKERVAQVYEAVRAARKTVVTAAEYLGQVPRVLGGEK